jgi:hypothetical protein
MSNQIAFVGDTGLQFRVYAGINLSTASSIIMKVKKSNNASVSWTASYDTNNPYYATYSTVSGDLSVAGDYILSLSVTIGSSTYSGKSALFTVYNQLEDNA